MVCLAILMHLAWGVLALISPFSTGSTGMSIVLLWTQSQHLQAAVFFAVAFLAFAGVFLTRQPLVTALAVTPQCVLLLASAAAAVRAVYLGEYADGTGRHWTFIASDQLLHILFAAYYTRAVIKHLLHRE